MSEDNKTPDDNLSSTDPLDESSAETSIFKLPSNTGAPDAPMESQGSSPLVEDVTIADVELPRREKKKSKVKAFFKYFFLITFVIALLGPAQYVLYSNRVQPNIYIGDIEIGGMTKATAVNLLSKEYSELINKPVLYVVKGKTKEFDSNDHDVQIFIKKTVDRAYAIGREEDVLKGAQTRLELLTKKTVLEPSFEIDQDSMDRFLNNVAERTDRPKREADIDLSSGDPVIIKSLIGFKLDKKTLEKDILEQSFRKKRSKVLVEPKKIIPDVSTPGAEQAMTETKNIINSEIFLVETTSKFRLRIATSDIRSFVQFSKETAAEPLSNKTKYTLKTGFDEEIVTAYLLLKCKALIIEPVEASFLIKGDTVSISQSKDGKTIDVHETSELVLEAGRQGGSHDVAIAFAKKVPATSTQQAQGFGIKEPIAVFTTDFDTNFTERVTFIKALSDLLNGKRIQPGETFSLNEHMAEKGGHQYYQESPLEINGAYLPSNGGASAQVATTLFNAAFFAGIKIDERTNIGHYVAKYPPGRDASVASPKPDLRLTNDLPHHILIESAVGPDKITVRLFSTKTTRKVFLKSSGFSNFVPFITETEMDASLDVGSTAKKEDGVDGRRITITRTVKDGEKTIHEDSFVSYYVPKNQIIKVGTNSSLTSTTLPSDESPTGLDTTTTTVSTNTTASTSTTVTTTTTTTVPPTTTTLEGGGTGQ